MVDLVEELARLIHQNELQAFELATLGIELVQQEMEKLAMADQRM